MSSFVYFWSQVWPNLAASVIWGTPAGLGFVWHHRRLKRHIDLRHAETRDHVNSAMEGGQ